MKVSYSGKWSIDKHAFLTALHFAFQYNDWKAEYESLADTSRAITYSDMPHGNGTSDPTADNGMRMAELRRKMQIVELCAEEAGGSLGKWILLAVTNEGVGYHSLRMRYGIPCGKDAYYMRRRKFYYLLSSRI